MNEYHFGIFMSGYLYISNNLKDIKENHIWII